MKAIHTAGGFGCAPGAARLSVLASVTVLAASCWFGDASRAEDDPTRTPGLRAADTPIDFAVPIARLSWHSRPPTTDSVFKGHHAPPALHFGGVVPSRVPRSATDEDRAVVRLIAPAGRGEQHLQKTERSNQCSPAAPSTLRLQSITDATDEPDPLQIVLSPKTSAPRHAATQVGWWRPGRPATTLSVLDRRAGDAASPLTSVESPCVDP